MADAKDDPSRDRDRDSSRDNRGSRDRDVLVPAGEEEEARDSLAEGLSDRGNKGSSSSIKKDSAFENEDNLSTTNAS